MLRAQQPSRAGLETGGGARTKEAGQGIRQETKELSSTDAFISHCKHYMFNRLTGSQVA